MVRSLTRIDSKVFQPGQGPPWYQKNVDNPTSEQKPYEGSAV